MKFQLALDERSLTREDLPKSQQLKIKEIEKLKTQIEKIESDGVDDSFKDEFAIEAMKIQGSGWAYLAYDGKIKTIKNHEVRDDILLLVDWWEHAFILDYGSDKKKYLSELWKIINWNVINTRWGKSL